MSEQAADTITRITRERDAALARAEAWRAECVRIAQRLDDYCMGGDRIGDSLLDIRADANAAANRATDRLIPASAPPAPTAAFGDTDPERCPSCHSLHGHTFNCESVFPPKPVSIGDGDTISASVPTPIQLRNAIAAICGALENTPGIRWPPSISEHVLSVLASAPPARKGEKCPFCEESPCVHGDECNSYAAAVYRYNKNHPTPVAESKPQSDGCHICHGDPRTQQFCSACKPAPVAEKDWAQEHHAVCVELAECKTALTAMRERAEKADGCRFEVHITGALVNPIARFMYHDQAMSWAMDNYAGKYEIVQVRK